MKNINPWLHIWFHPKETMILQTSKEKNNGFHILCYLAGAIFLLTSFQMIALGYLYGFFLILLLLVLLAWPMGYIFFSINAFFLFITGKWLKGHAEYKHVRLAYAWSHVPLVVSLVIWGLLLLLYRNVVFINFPGEVVFAETEIVFLFILMVMQLIAYVWIFILMIQTLSQVQKFSVTRSIVNVILSIIVSIVAFFCLSIFFLWIWGLLFNPFMN